MKIRLQLPKISEPNILIKVIDINTGIVDTAHINDLNIEIDGYNYIIVDVPEDTQTHASWFDMNSDAEGEMIGTYYLREVPDEYVGTRFDTNDAKTVERLNEGLIRSITFE